MENIIKQRYTNIIENLVAHRQKLGFSQQDLAQALHCDVAHIEAIENGSARMDVMEFVLFCEGIGLCCAEFIKQYSALKPL